MRSPEYSLDFRLKTFEQGESVSGSPGKPDGDPAIVDRSYFPRVSLHDGVAQRNLTIPRHGNLVVPRDGDDRRTAYPFR
jgi:hypothetical protein